MRIEKTGFIFDMDGTLVDNMKHHFLAWERFFFDMGKNIPVQKLLPLIAGKTSEEAIKLTLGDGIPKKKIQEYVDQKEFIYRDIYSRCLEPIPGVIEFLSNSQSVGIPMAIATSAPQINIDFTIDGLNIRNYFDIIVGSEGIINGKPDPEIYITAAAKLDIRPGKCIVFEDSIIGVEAAIRAGMKVVIIATSFGRKDFGKDSAVLKIVNNFVGLNLKDLLIK